MTECERIIAQGILPSSFFAEEKRNDFLVTCERKKIWGVLLDLLLTFDKFCQTHGLTYYLSGGSLLGAVRHKGFIPWDDDIDINMKREDYERLLEVGHNLPFPYFLETPYSSPECFYSHTRLVNDNTTAFSKSFVYQPMHHGIFIDIFPMDNWLEDDEERFEQIKALNMENSTYMRMKNPHLSEEERQRVKTWRGIPPIDVYEKVQELAQRDNGIPTEYMMAGTITNYKFKKKLRPKAAYQKAVPYIFEGFRFLGPEDADQVLRIQYGDYMQLPPVEKRGIWHDNAIFNADISYKDFLKTYNL